MHKSGLMLLCMIVIALGGARVARAQDGAASLDDQIQNKYSEREPEKAKTSHEKDKAKINNNDGQRKHWWSLPHFHHKKESRNSAAPQPQRNLKTAAAKPTNKTIAQQPSAHKVSGSRSVHAPVAGKKDAHNAVSSATPKKKAVASTSKARKPLHRDCSAAEAKSGDCQAAQKRSARASTSRS
jgi:hypothetical protein